MEDVTEKTQLYTREEFDNGVSPALLPFFSIGVTTYNRRELLKQALAAITEQTFSDFEVLVGNDYPQEHLSAKLVGIEDSRIRFVNHPRNLGETNNMNSLLGMARGRYFTWLADDDLYASDFLEAVHTALIRFDFPLCAFTSCLMGATYSVEKGDSPLGAPRLLTGRQFLREYLARSLQPIGCYGVFDIHYLRRIGGMEQLGNGYSPYSEVLLAIRCGLLEKVVYIDAPLVFFRTHEGSLSWTSPDVRVYRSSQEDLCRQSVMIFRSEGLREDFPWNLFLLLRWCIRDFAYIVGRAGFISAREASGYLFFLGRYIRLLSGSTLFWRAISFLIKTVSRGVSSRLRKRIAEL